MRLICLLYTGLPPEVQNESFKCVGISHCMYRHSGHRMVLFLLALTQLWPAFNQLRVHFPYKYITVICSCVQGKKAANSLWVLCLLLVGVCGVLFWGFFFVKLGVNKSRKNSKDADCKSLVYLVNSSIFLQSTKQRSLQHKWILQHNMDSTK